MGELEQYNFIAVEMQRYRARMLKQMPQESTDEQSRDPARRALNQFALWKGWCAWPPTSTRAWSTWIWHRPLPCR